VLAGINLTRKRIVVTEYNSGIGFATMKALSANGARTIGLARRRWMKQRPHAVQQVAR
jgi:NAD(P)-dependent dehydrogenase (short-subunit alcohol dehydrogenase family)